MKKRKLFHLLMHIGRLLQQQISNELAPLGLHHGQARTLEILQNCGQITQANLARAMGIKPATLTNMLKPLEKRGLIQRHTDERTNRAIVVALSSKGDRFASEAKGAWETVEQRLLAALDPQEGAVFAQLVQLRDALGGKPPEIVPYQTEDTP